LFIKKANSYLTVVKKKRRKGNQQLAFYLHIKLQSFSTWHFILGNILRKYDIKYGQERKCGQEKYTPKCARKYGAENVV